VTRSLLTSCRPSFFTLLPPPPRSTLFPYTTLFRSTSDRHGKGCERHARLVTCDTACRVSEHGEEVRRPGRRSADEPGEEQPYSRSEEHTSELQSRFDLVCRLLLEKKKRVRKLSRDG